MCNFFKSRDGILKCYQLQKKSNMYKEFNFPLFFDIIDSTVAFMYAFYGKFREN